MERVIVGASTVLFVLTWTFVILLFFQDSSSPLVANPHNISEEIAIIDKQSTDFYSIIEEREKIDEEKNAPTMEKSESASLSNGLESQFPQQEGVSIDELLDWLDLTDEINEETTQ
ncbi:hypothetical protein CEY16_06015 [Halalkalibacillus sediminis]|uniref:Uncharacterized protein n=1 Tax=Halalkalibacillus sediminis TaxID=2018042 RepID=A0A2I0QY86_9BACI|nr:hypothetical protein [Halalkalibacillus sediminis]PKR79293.1 hypothetical protein CEY16_06015 [Halalkalibacillus sediminis]